MISKIVVAVVIAIVVGLVCMYLLGPIVLSLGVPIAAIFGGFLVRWGWTIGVLAGLYHYFKS